MKSPYKIYTKGTRCEPPVKRWLLIAEFRKLEDAEGWIYLKRSTTSPEDNDEIEYIIKRNGMIVASHTTHLAVA